MKKRDVITLSIGMVVAGLLCWLACESGSRRVLHVRDEGGLIFVVDELTSAPFPINLTGWHASYYRCAVYSGDKELSSFLIPDDDTFFGPLSYRVIPRPPLVAGAPDPGGLTVEIFETTGSRYVSCTIAPYEDVTWSYKK
jgi:hypothetical protein